METIQKVLIFLLLSHFSYAEDYSLPPIFPKETVLISDPSLGIIDILKGYGYQHTWEKTPQGIKHMLVWIREDKHVQMQFTLPFSFQDILIHPELNSVILVEISVQSERTHHWVTEHVDFRSAERIAAIFQIAQWEGTIPQNSEKLHEQHVMSISHWRKGIQLFLSHRKFSKQSDSEYQWSFYGGVWSQKGCYSVRIRLVDDFSSEAVLAEVIVLDGKGRKSTALFHISSKTSFFVLDSLIEELVGIRDAQKAFELMEYAARGEFYEKKMGRYQMLQSAFLLNSLREFENRRIAGSGPQMPVLEYMARTFKIYAERNDLNVPDALKDMRTALGGVIKIDSLALEKDPLLRRELMEFLRENSHIDTCPYRVSPLLEDIFRRAISRQIRH